MPFQVIPREQAFFGLFERSGMVEIVDSTDLRTRQIVPDAPSRLLQRLRLDGVRIALGDEVWLRSREANIKLGGSLNVRSAKNLGALPGGRKGSRDRGDSLSLALEGTLTADRGTYTLDLAPAPVQREFAVQNGSITFSGSTELNPYLDINATHDVKRAAQPDLVITVHIVGPLSPHPAIAFTSSEPYLSTSDLISYLITGQPTYALNGNFAALD